MFLICYDICDPRRLNQLHRFLKEYGYNSQKSVFECDLDGEMVDDIRRYCHSELDLAVDAVRIYSICNACAGKVSILGIGEKLMSFDYQIV